VAYLNSAVIPKWLELLRALVPQVQIFAALVNPKSPIAEISTKDAQDAAQIAILAARYAIATSHEFRAFPAVGGLMSYGSSNSDGWYKVGVYAGRISQGR
jgi:hypothetical protein